MGLLNSRFGSLVLATSLAALASANCGGSAFTTLSAPPGDGGASSGNGGSSSGGSSAGSADGGSSGTGSDSGAPGSGVTIGGTVSGLNGTLVLQNGGDQVTISRNGSFVFPQTRPPGSTYDVTVASQPDGQVCTVDGGNGQVTGKVTSIQVTCASRSGGGGYAIGGTVFGLGIANLVLQDNGGDDLSLSQAGTFMFSHPLPDGATYDVTVSMQPQGRTCTVQNGSGTVSGADVTDVAVVCR